MNTRNLSNLIQLRIWTLWFQVNAIVFLIYKTAFLWPIINCPTTRPFHSWLHVSLHGKGDKLLINKIVNQVNAFVVPIKCLFVGHVFYALSILSIGPWPEIIVQSNRRGHRSLFLGETCQSTPGLTHSITCIMYTFVQFYSADQLYVHRRGLMPGVCTDGQRQ